MGVYIHGGSRERELHWRAILGIRMHASDGTILLARWNSRLVDESGVSRDLVRWSWMNRAWNASCW